MRSLHRNTTICFQKMIYGLLSLLNDTRTASRRAGKYLRELQFRLDLHRFLVRVPRLAGLGSSKSTIS